MTDLVRQMAASYPQEVQAMLMRLQALIQQSAKDYKLGALDVSLKWGVPSFVIDGGSAIRLGWKSAVPDKCFLYFHCQTRLIETFKEIYGDTFQYEGKRAIAVPLGKTLLENELKHCIALSLQYHKLKHLPLLGA